MSDLKRLQSEIGFLLDQEDARWKQRAKVHWLTKGDRNTKFYHACVNQRRKKNNIKQIEDEEGRVLSSKEEVAIGFWLHFKQVYQSANPSERTIQQCLSGVRHRISQHKREYMDREFTSEEVLVALKQMSPFKSPGPDGFNAGFFQDHWDIVGSEVMQAVLNFFRTAEMPTGLNHTLIALIPKTSTPRSVNEYRPIGLCNVWYKLISKVLANRLKSVLQDIISWNQSAFLPGRLITDNIMVAYELLHTMQARQKGKEGSMAIKLDMSKAYDRVEWGFLQSMLSKLGFSDKWRKLIMVCVETVSYSVVVNGTPGAVFRPTRGLRQGDPLSPYLFLLCAEGLSSLLKNAEVRGLIKGVAVARGGKRINHLLFANDCVMFCRSNSNTRPEARTCILQQAEGVVCGNYNKYLGLPTTVGRSKYNTFRGLKEKIWKRINSWKTTFLSSAGKEVMIKSVLQAILAYTMSVFKMPSVLLKEIESMIAKFWWNHRKEGRGIYWKSWSKLGTAKNKGGLGFRDLNCFNRALLAKQGWRIIQEPASLLAQVFKEKYFKTGNLMEARVGYCPSQIWRSLMSVKDLIKTGLVWRVGNGRSIKIWKDKWVSIPSTFKVQTPNKILDYNATVSELIEDESKTWKKELVQAIFSQEEAKRICSIPISVKGMDDKMIWGLSEKGTFTVKSAYHADLGIKNQNMGETSSGDQSKGLWGRLWRLTSSSKVKIFLWKALNGILPTRSTLFKRKVTDNSTCPICSREEETDIHVLWDCPAAVDVWGEDCSPVRNWGRSFGDFTSLWSELQSKLEEGELHIVAEVFYGLWRRRNAMVFEGKFKGPCVLIQQAVRDAEAVTSAHEKQREDQTRPVETVRTVWKPPSQDFLKVNVDAAVDSKRGKVGIGVVVRDFRGELEGDAKVVVEAINSRPFNSSWDGQVIKDIKAAMQDQPGWSVAFVRREGNGAAHAAARLALSLDTEGVWVEEVLSSKELVFPVSNKEVCYKWCPETRPMKKMAEGTRLKDLQEGLNALKKVADAQY
ncbi:uncharacterized protein LOC122293655 [Carya illinoinensis]|uniref:uncharacterized protein LOC122293655 n=1 Tax=Carya illinoinensis TaxID=32201 RepID=UPI001C729C9C|nr:uncharacterized protein LOC122293655 [Carya illinoinensis]